MIGTIMKLKLLIAAVIASALVTGHVSMFDIIHGGKIDQWTEALGLYLCAIGALTAVHPLLADTSKEPEQWRLRHSTLIISNGSVLAFIIGVASAYVPVVNENAIGFGIAIASAVVLSHWYYYLIRPWVKGPMSPASDAM
jgi:hypothetical protein